jgi:transposase
METKKKNQTGRRQYDADFKKSAVQLVLNGQSVPQVSQSLGIGESLLYKWRAEMSVRQTEVKQPLEEENERLRKEVRQLELERDILKKALGIFSRMT